MNLQISIFENCLKRSNIGIKFEKAPKYRNESLNKKILWRIKEGIISTARLLTHSKFKCIQTFKGSSRRVPVRVQFKLSSRCQITLFWSDWTNFMFSSMVIIRLEDNLLTRKEKEILKVMLERSVCVKLAVWY